LELPVLRDTCQYIWWQHNTRTGAMKMYALGANCAELMKSAQQADGFALAIGVFLAHVCSPDKATRESAQALCKDLDYLTDQGREFIRRSGQAERQGNPGVRLLRAQYSGGFHGPWGPVVTPTLYCMSCRGHWS
jgi:hypothetical protein